MSFIALRPTLTAETVCAVSSRYDGQGGEFDLAGQGETFQANLQRLQKSLNLSACVWLRQAHGDQIVEADPQAEPALADGLFTTTPGVGLLIRQADCQALVLAAPGLAANFHVGWRGNALNLPGRGLDFLCRRFNLRPWHFQAYLSPSLGPCCGEFINYRQELPKFMWPFQVQGLNFNLWAVTAWQLFRAGLPRANLRLSALCSKCQVGKFFSHRRQDKGRFATIVALT
jgi:copper oxidase (laccase) domain-containing protein